MGNQITKKERLQKRKRKIRVKVKRKVLLVLAPIYGYCIMQITSGVETLALSIRCAVPSGQYTLSPFWALLKRLPHSFRFEQPSQSLDSILFSSPLIQQQIKEKAPI